MKYLHPHGLWFHHHSYAAQLPIAAGCCFDIDFGVVRLSPMNKGTNLFDVAMLFHDFCISANSVVPNRFGIRVTH